MMLTTTTKLNLSAPTVNRSSPSSVDDALQILRQQTIMTMQTQPLIQTRSLLQARGYVLAQTVYAKIDSPAFDNSAMDGYAINSDNTQNLFPISQRICAGDQPSLLQPGTAARIYTGAPIPEGADTVVIQENCTVKNGLLLINTPSISDQHIRRRGEEYRSGSQLLVQGRQLGPQDLALCAASGNHQVTVYSAPRVALITCGNELVNNDKSLASGQIYNSNLTLLHGLIEEAGGVVTQTHTLPDKLNVTKALLDKLSSEVDIIISSGGVSSGDEDYLPQAISEIGNVHFWKLAIKPGKPVLFGEINHTPILALPGNPGASFVIFTLLGKALIKQHSGQQDWRPLHITALASFSKENLSTRDHYLFVQHHAGQVALFNQQGSNQMLPAASCNALLLLRAGSTIDKGQQVEVLFYANHG